MNSSILSEEEDENLVPNWLMDVLAWIDRLAMANSALSYACRLFQQICWPKLHGNAVQPHSINLLVFCQNGGEIAAHENAHGMANRRVAQLKLRLNHNEQQFLIVPIAGGIAPPEYILGIKEIQFHFIDGQVLEFVRSILPLLKNRSRLVLDIYHGLLCRPAEPKLLHLFQMLAQNGLFEINFLFSTQYFHTFNQTYPGIFEHAQSLLLPFEQPDADSLFNWLMEKRQNGCQKWLNLRKAKRREEVEFMARILKEFCNTMEPSNFAIRFFHLHDQFAMENVATGEQLVSYHKQDGRRQRNFLIRFPRGENVEHWKEKSEMVFQTKRMMENGSTFLYFHDIIDGCWEHND